MLIETLVGKKGVYWIALSVLLSFVLAVIEYGIAIVIQILIYSFGISEQHQLPNMISPYVQYINSTTAVVILLSISLIRFIAQFLNNLIPSVINELVNARMRLLRVYNILISKGSKRPPSADMLNHITEIFPKAGAFLFHSTRIVSITLQVLLIFMGMFLTAWKESLLSTMLLALLAVTMYYLQSKVKEKAMILPSLNRTIIDCVNRVLKNWVFIRISSAEHRMSNELNKSIFMYFDRVVKTAIYNHATTAVAPLAGTIAICVVIIASQTFFFTQASSLLIFLYLFVRFNQQLAVLSQSIGVANSMYPHFSEVRSFLKPFSDKEIQDGLKIAENLNVFSDQKLVTLSGPSANQSGLIKEASNHPPALKLDKISYGWDKNPKIFKDFSFTVKPGEQLAIVGRSGSGKSTLLSLILGLVEPICGTIEIDNMNPHDYLKKFSNKIAYAGVDPYLTSGSIRDNILFGIENDVTEDEIKFALNASALSDDLKKLPGGLDYMLSENGDGLSAGQKQRISFARAVIKKPQIMILDEATANLDERTEKNIISSVNKLRGMCTVILVSHKPEAIKYADKKIDLDAYRFC